MKKKVENIISISLNASLQVKLLFREGFNHFYTSIVKVFFPVLLLPQAYEVIYINAIQFMQTWKLLTYLLTYLPIYVCKSCIRLEIAPIYIGRVLAFLNKVIFAEYISMPPVKSYVQ